MKINDGGILIISGPRTGSSNLLKSISFAYNKKFVFEPDIFETPPLYDSSKDVVKIIPLKKYHLDKGYDFLPIAKQFNTVVLLNRRNREEQLESLYVMGTDKKTGIKKRWGIEKEIDKDSNYYGYLAQWMDELDIVLNKLSEDLNIPIDYYEDVYKNKTLSNKDINLELEYLNPKYKLRQVKPKTII